MNISLIFVFLCSQFIHFCFGDLFCDFMYLNNQPCGISINRHTLRSTRALTHQLQRGPTLGELAFMQPIHSISAALIDQLAHQLQREPTLGEIAVMLGKASTGPQIYQVEELKSKKELEKRNNEIEKIIPEILFGEMCVRSCYAK